MLLCAHGWIFPFHRSLDNNTITEYRCVACIYYYYFFFLWTWAVAVTTVYIYIYMYICFEEDSSTYLLFVSMNEPNYLVNLIASRPGQNRHGKINPNHYTSPAPFAFTKLQLGST